MLDASADQKSYEVLFEGTHTISSHMFAAPIDRSERTIVFGRSFSTTSLTRMQGKDKNNRDRAAETKKTVQTLDCVLDAIAKREVGRKILVVTSMKNTKAINDGKIGKNFMKTSDVELAYFKSLRGQNAFQNFDTVVIIGKLELDDMSARRIAAAYSRRPMEILKQRVESESTDVTIHLRNSKVGEIRTHRYKDEDLARIQYNVREAEISQCEQRLRSIRRSDEDVRSYIIGNSIPDDMVFDHVYKVTDFVEETLTNVAEESLGCLSLKAYAKSRNVQMNSARKSLKARGFTGNGAPEGWRTFYAKKASQSTPSPVWVPHDVVNVSEAVKAHLAEVNDCDPSLIVICEAA